MIAFQKFSQGDKDGKYIRKEMMTVAKYNMASTKADFDWLHFEAR